MGQLWIMLNTRHHHPVLLVKSLIDKIWSNESSNTENMVSPGLLSGACHYFMTLLRVIILQSVCLTSSTSSIITTDPEILFPSLPTFRNTYALTTFTLRFLWVSNSWKNTIFMCLMRFHTQNRARHKPSEAFRFRVTLLLLNYERFCSVSAIWTWWRTMRMVS